VAADGTSLTTISVHVANAAGGSVPGAGVVVTYTTNTGSSTGITPGSGMTGTTDVNGNVTFQVRSTQNATLTFTATATALGQTITLSQRPTVTFGTGGTTGGGGGTVATTGTMTADWCQLPPGQETTLTLTLLNGTTPVSGKNITLSVNPSSAAQF